MIETYDIDRSLGKAQVKASQLQGGVFRCNQEDYDAHTETFIEGPIVEVTLGEDFLDVCCEHLQAVDRDSGVWHRLSKHSVRRARHEFSRSQFDSAGIFTFYKPGEALTLFPPQKTALYSNLAITTDLLSKYVGGTLGGFSGIGSEECAFEVTLANAVVEDDQVVLTLHSCHRLAGEEEALRKQDVSETRRSLSDWPFAEILSDGRLSISCWDATMVFEQPRAIDMSTVSTL